jgi:exosortase B
MPFPGDHARLPMFTAWQPRWTRPVLLALGLIALYLPTYVHLARTVWSTDEQGHGPLIVALCAWLIYQRWPLLSALPDKPARLLAGIALTLSLAGFVLGRSQNIDTLEAASQIGVLGALVLWFKGFAGLRVMWVPLAFLMFAVPLPSVLVQQLTMPLKAAVSGCAEWLLQHAGYPVGRTGVILSIGQYQLLVADACAGINSMFTLEALGFLWMSMRKRTSMRGAIWRDAALAVVILPISFTANVVRVLALVLVTYYFGDSAGKGFTHAFSGLVLFVVAVLLMMLADTLLYRGTGASMRLQRASVAASPTVRAALTGDGQPVVRRRAYTAWLLTSMLLAAWLSHGLKPTRQLANELPSVHLEAQVPSEFAGWTIDSTTIPILPDPVLQARLASVYTQTLARTYVNAAGDRVMLTIAYGSDQSSEVTAVHRPEFCYGAQGFKVRTKGVQRVALEDGASVLVQRLVGTLGRRVEPISYWVTLAQQAALPGFDRKWWQIRMGLAGWVADGMLVRVSTIGGSPQSPYAAQDRFLHDLAQALPEVVRSRYFGA